VKNPVQLCAALRSLLDLRVEGDQVNQRISEVVEKLTVQPVGLVLFEVVISILRQPLPSKFIQPRRVHDR
jgi:hypothetical protein